MNLYIANLLGMKYPASPMMGGRRNKKKISGVRVFGSASSSRTKKKNSPIRIPTMIKTLDSGKNLLIHVAFWKPKICIYKKSLRRQAFSREIFYTKLFLNLPEKSEFPLNSSEKMSRAFHLPTLMIAVRMIQSPMA